MKFIYIRKQWIFVVVFALFLVLAGWYMVQPVTIFTSGQTEGSENQYTIHMVQGEFSAKQKMEKKLKPIAGIPVQLLYQKIKK